MKVKFEKGSREWQLFMGLWDLCQKYWKVEPDNDDFWNAFILDSDNFLKQFDPVENTSEGRIFKALARDLVFAVMNRMNAMDQVERNK